MGTREVWAHIEVSACDGIKIGGGVLGMAEVERREPVLAARMLYRQFEYVGVAPRDKS